MCFAQCHTCRYAGNVSDLSLYSSTSTPVEMDLVTPDQLPDVANRLSRVKGKWYDIGMELGIQTSELDVIRDRHISRRKSMAEVIKIWHQGAKPT